MNTSASEYNRNNNDIDIEVINDSYSSIQSSSPPLTTTVTSTAIREFCSTTSRYLNEFAFNASTRLESVSRKIDDLDVQVQFLEYKVNNTTGKDVNEKENAGAQKDFT